MRKKLIALALIVIVMAALLSSCTLFEVNTERDNNQVLASVTVDGMTGEITKGEFIEYFSQNAGMYINNFGWSIQKCVDEFLQTLAKKEIMLLEARSYFAKKDTSLKKDGDIMTFFTANERAWIYNRTNKMFEELVDSELKKILPSHGDTDEDSLAARPIYEEEDIYAEYDEDVKVEGEAKSYFDIMKERDDLTKNQLKAIQKVEEQLKKAYRNYDYYLNQYAESRLLNKYREAKTGDLNVQISDQDIIDKYNLTLDNQKAMYALESAYASALESDGIIVYHNGKYVKVKSILLQFSEEQKAILEQIKNYWQGKGGDNTIDFINADREALVTGGDLSAALGLGVDTKHLGLLVNVSNPDYEPNAECLAKENECECVACRNNKNYKEDGDAVCKVDRFAVYTQEDYDKGVITDASLIGKYKRVSGCSCLACENNAYSEYNVPFKEVIGNIEKAVNEAAEKAAAEYDTKYTNGSEIGKQLFIEQAKIDAFERQIYLYNDDSGMFEGNDYIGTPAGSESSYVEEYTGLLRALASKGEVGNMGGLEELSYKDDSMKNEVAIYAEGGVNYIINDYGVHIIMITELPVNEKVNEGIEGAITEETVTDANGNDVILYTLSLDAVIGFDEKTGKEITVRSAIEKTLREERETNAYNNFEREYFLNNYGKNVLDSDKVNVSKDVYNQIIDWSGAKQQADAEE